MKSEYSFNRRYATKGLRALLRVLKPTATFSGSLREGRKHPPLITAAPGLSQGMQTEEDGRVGGINGDRDGADNSSRHRSPACADAGAVGFALEGVTWEAGGIPGQRQIAAAARVVQDRRTGNTAEVKFEGSCASHQTITTGIRRR